MSITSLGWDEYHTSGVGAHLSVVLVASGITIGGSIGLLFLSVIALVQRPKPRKRPVITTFFAAILSLLLLLGFCITQVVLVQARLASEGYRVYGGVYGFFGPTSTVALRRAKVFFEQALMIVGDIVIVGRAKAIYPDQRWIGIGLTSLWVVTVGWGVAFYTALSIDIDHPETYYSLNKYAAIFAGLSATVNVLATSLIGYRLWSYRQFLKKEIGLRKPRYTRAQRALLVMIESGCVYRLTQLTFYLYGLVVVYTPGNASQNAVDALPIVQQIFYIVSGLYPVSLYILLSIQSRRGEHFSIIDMNITRSSS